MSDASSSSVMNDMDLDDWIAEEDDNDLDQLVSELDGRRQVENKLEELRLRRELNEYSFDV
ncbi:MAG: PA3496 family putative envelope integrity protein [Cellvibrionaceae bacterium]